MSLRSEFRVVMSVTISAYKRCSHRLYLQLYVGVFTFIFISYSRSLCLLAHSGVQHILCLCLWFVFRCPVYHLLPVSLDCKILIAPSVFPNIY